jgi:hypothetical protein
LRKSGFKRGPDVRKLRACWACWGNFDGDDLQQIADGVSLGAIFEKKHDQTILIQQTSAAPRGVAG